MSTSKESPLTSEQVQTFLRDGIVVVPLLSSDELREAQHGLIETLSKEFGVDVQDLERTGIGLMDASSTNGAGGVLDIFYPEWKMKIATNEKLFRMTCQLWKEAFCHDGECSEEMQSKVADEGVDESFKWHPFGAFDCDRGYMYIDRIGFRIPTDTAEEIGKTIASEKQHSDNTIMRNQTKKKWRHRPIQRSLTPHFDCCPETYHDIANKTKWRPIQCFVSLTDNLQPNTGGFEAVPGFHREFHAWTQNGRRSAHEDEQPTHPCPCVGEYTHINPSHDRAILDRVTHIPVKSGHAVFWDNRIPHGNAYRNDSHLHDQTEKNETSLTVLKESGARAVVYCSFLPDIDINRCFVKRQLIDWKCQRAPRVGDRWIKREESDEANNYQEQTINDSASQLESRLTKVGRKLLGLDEWCR